MKGCWLPRCWLALSSVEGLLVGAALLAACQKSPSSTDRFQSIHLVSPQGQQIELQVEIADESAEYARGLMFRESLPEGQGMVFLFDREEMLIFWMKNTLIPLDILFFDREGRFVSGATMDPCRRDPCPTYPSAAPAKFALEVPAGFLAKHGVGEGWRMEW